MSTLGSLIQGTVTIEGVIHMDPAMIAIYTGIQPGKSDAEVIAEVHSLTAAAGLDVSESEIHAALHQDDDAHDTCSLTACLNPLHPGPCKGWKGTLFKTAPGAWHSLEAAKVEKANAARIKKIESLKAQGKPIPKKLLTPIVAKPPPNAGQTANKATGEAHAAGKAVTDAAGVHTQTPGKVTLGQAVKSMGPVEKGPKGKKPTLASKGIAFVIGQEKVTPQYKLDKAAAITPEQWAGLSEADQSSIRGELAKIKIDGFGPQQKKADELLAKLAPGAQPKPGGLKPGDPNTITTPSGKTYQKVTLKEASEPPKPAAPAKAPEPKPEPPKPEPKPEVAPEVAKALEKAKANPPKVTEMHEPSGEPGSTAAQATAVRSIADAIYGKQSMALTQLAANIDKMKAGGKKIEDHPGFKKLVNTFAQAAMKKADADKMPGLGHGENDIGITEFNHQIRDHIAQGKPGLPPVIKKMAEHHEAIKPENVKKAVEKAAQDAAAKKVVEKAEAAPPTVKEMTETGGPVKVSPTSVGVGDTVEGNLISGSHVVAKILLSKTQMKNSHQTLTFVNEDGEEFFVGKTNAKATLVSKAKGDVPAADVAKSSEKAAGVDADTTPMTPINLVSKIQKDGSADVILGGKKIKVGFQGTKFDGKLTFVNGLGKGTGHYVVTTTDGTKYQIGKGENVTVAKTTSPVPGAAPFTPDALPTPKPVAATPKAITKALDETAAPAAAQAKPQPAHVEQAIAMAEGNAPGASWAKNQLAAYQALSGAEFDALPQKIQDKIVADLKKGVAKFLDPKKVIATKKLLAEFGHGDGKPADAVPTKATPSFSEALKDPDLSEAQAKRLAAQAAPKDLLAVAKNAAGVTEEEDPDNGATQAADADAAAKALVDQQTKPYTDAVLDKPEVAKAIVALNVAAIKEHYSVGLWKAKASAFSKVITAHKSPSANLTPLQKASLFEYGQYLLKHDKPDTSVPKIDELKAATKSAQNDLADKLHAAVKAANAPKVADMSNAQITDRAKELLGDLAVNPKTELTLKELQHASEMGKAKANEAAAKYPQAILGDPAVAAKLAALASVNTQINAANAEVHNLEDHIKQLHVAALSKGLDKNGNPLTEEDRNAIWAHSQLLKASKKYVYDTQQSQQAKLPGAESLFHAAAQAAEAKLKPAEPVTLSQFDQDTIGEVYRGAWGKTASKAVTYGIKTYGIKTQMAEHAEYPQFKADLSELQQLAGKLAVATGNAHTTKLNVPTGDSGAMEAGPEKQAWLQAVIDRNVLESQFEKLLKTAQGRLDTIRIDAGLKKRALPKLNSPAVKTMAAESAYYKTGGYGKPLYGKSASAKQYLVAKVGPELAVAHKTSSDKASEKNAKSAAEAAKVQAAMPAPKVHVKPPSSEVGKGPNATSAEVQGYHFTPKVAEGDQHGWPTSNNGAYVSSPEQLAELKEHLGKEDTKYGLAAQKEFKWSINNMEGKGGPSSGKKALYSYTGSSYGTINAKLNSLPPGTKKTGSSQIGSIDAAFAAAPPLEGDVILYRGFSNPESVFKSGKWNAVNVAGVEWSQRSYSSTSGALGTAQSFAGHSGVVMRIIIPKEMGVKGINAKGGQHPGENEIILERGIRYRVVADYGKGPNDSRRYIDVMVVPSPYDKPE